MTFVLYDSDFVLAIATCVGLAALLGLALWASKGEPQGLPSTWHDDRASLGD